MKLSTETIKRKLESYYNQKKIDASSLKRFKKFKNEDSSITRLFESNIGIITVKSDSDDKVILDIALSDMVPEKIITQKFNGYYFSVGKNKEFDSFVKKPYLHLIIVPKKYWDTHKVLYDQPLSSKLEEFLFKKTIESPNETSYFQAFDHEDSLKLINELELVGMEYSNEISKFVLKDGYKMQLKN